MPYSSFPRITARVAALVSLLVVSTGVPVACGGWTDDFESYEVGYFPPTPWSSSGNSDAYVDGTLSVSGSNSLRLFGIVGGCWGALAHREFTAAPQQMFSFYVCNGPEQLSGCHSIYGCAQLNTGPKWTYPARALIAFDVDDRSGEKLVRGCWIGNDPVDGPDLGRFESGLWYAVAIVYEAAADTVWLSYWIDSVFRGTYAFPSLSYESELCCLAVQAGEGTAWFDDVQVSDVTGSVDAIETPAAIALVVVGPNPLRDRTAISYVIPRPAAVRLAIYDISGHLVRDLSSRALEAGVRTIDWDGRDAAGNRSSSGVYLLQMEADGQTCSRKLCVVR